MKIFLLLILFACPIWLYAQQPPGPPAMTCISNWGEKPDSIIKKDAHFVFNKHYYELENRWFVIPIDDGYGRTRTYLFGFNYFDAQTGYTYIRTGDLNFDDNGRVYLDTAALHADKWLIPTKLPYKVQWIITSRLIAPMPDDMLKSLNLKKIPKWLPGYQKRHHNMPKTLDKRLIFGHIFTIYAKDAAQHIGQNRYVSGFIYGGKIIDDPKKPGSKMGLVFMGGNYPNQKFTTILTDLDEQELNKVKKIIATPIPEDRDELERSIYCARGVIFLHDGKPAVKMKALDLNTVDWVDMSPTMEQLANYR